MRANLPTLRVLVAVPAAGALIGIAAACGPASPSDHTAASGQHHAQTTPSSSGSGWHQVHPNVTGAPTFEGKCQMEPNLHTSIAGPTFIVTIRNPSGQDYAAQSVQVSFNRGAPYGASEFFPVPGHDSGGAKTDGSVPFDVAAGTTVEVESSNPLYPPNKSAPTSCWPTSYN